MRIPVNVCNEPVEHIFCPMSRIPDSRQESGDPVCDGLKLIDHHLYISCQVLAVLQPDDGGLEPGIGDVDGAVEFSLMAL